jgi:heptosyltransferase-2
MHVGAAAGVPVIEISCHPKDGSPSHPNSPVRFRPWGVPYLVVQPAVALTPCSDGCEAPTAHCITGVTLEQVQGAVDELLTAVQVGLSRTPGCPVRLAAGKPWPDAATRATAQCS